MSMIMNMNTTAVTAMIMNMTTTAMTMGTVHP
jgi:hypothetical protein